MTDQGQRAEQLRLMVWIMHRFAEVFRERALLKGGMQLMLLSSERATNDLDYVFVPFDSKREVVERIEAVLAEIPAARVERALHSSSGRFLIRTTGTSVQIEFNVAAQVLSEPVTTALVADRVGVPARVIRVMGKEVALAHKLAAWNERRLGRDLYDAYYWFAHVGATPDLTVLEARLDRIHSRLPALRKRKKMSLADFCTELESALAAISERKLADQLRPLMPANRLEGLLPVLKAKLSELVALIRSHSASDAGK